MTPTDQYKAFAQSVYRALKGRSFDDLDGEDGITYLEEVADATNLFLDELENAVDNENQPIDWNELIQYGASLGTATQGEASVSLDKKVISLLANEQRYVLIQQDGTTVSKWIVVEPRQITNSSVRYTEDMVAKVGTTLVFSRAFRDTENGGTVVGDYSIQYPRIAYTNGQSGFVPTNIKILTDYAPRQVPRQLLVLGVAKNVTLPDIVQGGLSPSYTQKYQDLLTGKMARNMATSKADEVVRDEYGFVRGVGF